MNTAIPAYARSRSAGAALLLVASLIAACSSGGGSSSSANSPGSIPSASADTPSASPAPLLSGQDPLSAGRYQVDPALPMKVTIEVPAGWSGDGWVAEGPNGHEAPAGMAIRFYTAANIYIDPLVPDDGLVDPPVGDSADALVAALVDHPDWNVSGTTPITMDGYAGQSVQVTLPEDTSSATPFYLFADPAGGQIWGWDPEQAFDIYVVDVGSERLIIDAFHFPGASEGDLAAQQAVLQSIQIDLAP